MGLAVGNLDHQPSVSQRHDSLLVMCLCIVSQHTGGLYSPMHSAPAMPFGGHSGEEMASLMLESLATHAACWGLHSLRARNSSVSEDGGLCVGGPEHRHQSSAAAEKYWRRTHDKPAVVYLGHDPVQAPTCTVWNRVVYRLQKVVYPLQKVVFVTGVARVDRDSSIAVRPAVEEPHGAGGDARPCADHIARRLAHRAAPPRLGACQQGGTAYYCYNYQCYYDDYYYYCYCYCYYYYYDDDYQCYYQ